MTTVEKKDICLVRVPPGDNWKDPDDLQGWTIFPSLTAGLEHIFQKTGIQEYRISAGEGEVFAITKQDVEPEPTPTFSLCGDE